MPINRQLCAAGHKRREQDSHLPIPVGRKSARRHNRGNTAAEADQHRHEGASRKSEFTQQFVHHKGHASHITAVFQERQEEEQDHDDRQEGQDAADAGADAIDDQRMQHIGYAYTAHPAVQPVGNPADALIQKILQGASQYGKRKPEHGEHDQQKDGDGQNSMCQQAVNLLGTLLLFCFLFFDDALTAGLFDIGIPHVRQGGLTVRTQAFFHVAHYMFDDMYLLLRDGEHLFGRFIALHQLRGGETGRTVTDLPPDLR